MSARRPSLGESDGPPRREDTAPASCPYCGEPVELLLDPGGDPVQVYVEDCPVCCRPWTVTARWDASGVATVALRAEDEG